VVPGSDTQSPSFYRFITLACMKYQNVLFTKRIGLPHKTSGFCASALLNKPPRSAFLAERQAMRDIMAVIRS
jgi:hypothetical protein